MIIQAITGFLIDKSDKRMQHVPTMKLAVKLPVKLPVKLKHSVSSLVFSTLVTINDAQIIELIQKNNTDLLLMRNQIKRFELSLEKAELNYQPYLNLDLSKETDNTDTLLSTNKQDLNKSRISAVLGKNFTTGTQLSLESTYFKTESEHNPSVLTSNFYQNNLNLNIQQQIFPDFLGNQEGQRFASIQKNLEKDILQNKIDQIELVKLRLADYWKLVSLTSQIDNQKVLIEKYSQLEKKVRRKASSNMASAGELEQTLAEVLTRQQTMIEDQNQLKQGLQKLKEDLLIASDSKMNLSYSVQKINLSPMPEKRTTELEKTIKYNLQKMKKEAAESDYLSIENSNLPDIKIYGKYGLQGLDPSSSEASTELHQAEKNKYVIGVKLNYSFGSDLNRTQHELYESTYQIEQQKYNRVQQDLIQNYEILYDKLSAAYNAVLTNQKIFDLRRTISKKINANYDQGRSDFLQLLDANNKEFNSKINLINSIGQFQILNYEYRELTSPLF
jgi:outer membrane protein TolC